MNEKWMPKLEFPNLEVGQHYLVVFKLPDQRKNRWMVATFMNAEGEHTQWSLRPLAGTQTLDLGEIVSVTETNAKISKPQLVGVK